MPVCKAIGIDLGTTSCRVAVWHNGRIEVITDGHGSPSTPSYVSFSHSERLIGERAQHQASANPDNTIFNFKRLLGRKIEEAEIQSHMKTSPYKLVSGSGKPVIKVQYRGKEMELLPEAIVAMLLQNLKETAESYLDLPVTGAVITVPITFSASQRQAIRDAGRIAGLTIFRIINEPTAAALAHAYDKDKEQRCNILVFNMGGSSLGVSLVRAEMGVVEVSATLGKPNLGGNDFDDRLVEHFARAFQHEHNKDLRGDKLAMSRLKAACEQAKCILSSDQLATIEIENLCCGISFGSSITRTEFETICEDLFQSALDPVEVVLRDLKNRKWTAQAVVHEVVLVGGSTRIPQLVKLISERLGKTALCISAGTETRAHGAALQAANLLLKHCSDGTVENSPDVLLIDAVPISCSFRVPNGRLVCFLQRNTTIPMGGFKVFCEENFGTKDVKGLQIDIYEGEGTEALEANVLGTIILSPAPFPQGVQGSGRCFRLRFEVDGEGLLRVNACEMVCSQQSQSWAMNSERGLSKDELDAMVAQAEQYREDEMKAAAAIAAKNRLKLYTDQIKDHNAKVEKAIVSILEWIETKPDASLEEFDRVRLALGTLATSDGSSDAQAESDGLGSVDVLAGAVAGLTLNTSGNERVYE